MTQQPLPVYANVCRVSFGAFDVTLDFGTVTPEQAAAGGQEQFAVAARVQMSVSHAKYMAQLVLALVEQYQRQFGTVPTPPAPKVG